MSDKIIIRKLGVTNIKALRELNKVFAVAFEDDITHLSKSPSDLYLTKLLAKQDFIALAVSVNEAIVGGLIAYVLEKYEQERSEIYIYDLAVEEQYRRNGFATQLIEELKAIGKKIGACAIFVQADREDLAAIKLYESLGTQSSPFHFDILV